MHVTELEDSAEFLQRAAPVLARNEAFTGLLYGIADRVGRVDASIPIDDQPLLALVEDRSDVCLTVVMTPPHRILLHGRGDTPEPAALHALIEFLSTTGRAPPGVLGPLPFPQAFASLWSERSGQSFGQGLAMTVYELRELHRPAAAPGLYRHATVADLALLEAWTDAFFLEVHGRPPGSGEQADVALRLAAGAYRIWEHDGRPVSYAAQSRPTPTGMAINAAYTPSELRGRGYATACVAALCAEILASGKQFCTLFADVDNPTANGIYQRLGFEPLGQFVELDFE